MNSSDLQKDASQELPAPAPPPAPPSQPKGWWGRFTTWIGWRTLAAAIASLIVIIASPFLLTSEATIKSYIESFVSGCLFVLEKEQVSSQRIRVRGYLYGKGPKDLPITFSAAEGTINRIAMINDAELDASMRGRSLAFHPQTNRACPGALCEDYGRDASAPKITIRLADVDPEFTYTFNVDLDKPLKPAGLLVYAQFDEGLKSGICRIEEADAFNWFARQGKGTKFLVLVGVFLVLTTVVAILKR